MVSYAPKRLPWGSNPMGMSIRLVQLVGRSGGSVPIPADGEMWTPHCCGLHHLARVGHLDRYNKNSMPCAWHLGQPLLLSNWCLEIFESQLYISISICIYNLKASDAMYRILSNKNIYNHRQ